MEDSTKKDFQSEKKEYFKIMLKLAFCILVLCALTRTIGSVTSQYTRSFDFQIQRLHKEMAQTRSNKADIVIVGDSTAARALLPRVFPETKMLSFSVYGGSLIDGFFLFKEYLKHNEPPKCVIVMTSYGAFSHHVQTMFWPLLVGNAFYSIEELQDLYSSGQKVQDFPSNDSKFNYWLKVIKNFDWKNGFQISDAQDLLFFPEKKSLAIRSYQSAMMNHGASSLRWETALNLGLAFYSESEAHLKSDFKIEKTLDHYIQRLFSLNSEMKIRTILLYHPLAAKWDLPQTKKWFLDYKKHILNLQMQFPLVENQLELEFHDNGWFTDGTHLTDDGGRRFSLTKKSLIESCRQGQEGSK